MLILQGNNMNINEEQLDDLLADHNTSVIELLSSVSNKPVNSEALFIHMR